MVSFMPDILVLSSFITCSNVIRVRVCSQDRRCCRAGSSIACVDLLLNFIGRFPWQAERHRQQVKIHIAVLLWRGTDGQNSAHAWSCQRNGDLHPLSYQNIPTIEPCALPTSLQGQMLKITLPLMLSWSQKLHIAFYP
jgi:hypothetical protein